MVPVPLEAAGAKEPHRTLAERQTELSSGNMQGVHTQT